MVSTKRVILAEGSRLLREMLHRVLDQAESLEVVVEVSAAGDLPSAIERFDPAWVIVSGPYGRPVQGWVRACLADHPSVRFLFLSPDRNHITMKWHLFSEERVAEVTLKDFIHILERDVRHN